MHRPLLAVAAGLALVALDFRTESLDLVADPVGWVLVALGAGLLGFRLPVWAAGAAAVLSVGDAFLPYRYVYFDPVTGDDVVTSTGLDLGYPQRVEFDPVSGARLAVLALALVVGSVAVLSLLRGLQRRAASTEDAAATRRLSLLIAAVVLGWLVPPAIVMGRAAASSSGRYDPIWNGTLEYAGLLGWVVLGWVAVELALRCGATWAVPAGEEPSPWAQRYT